MWCWIYLLISSAVTLSPTVHAKYPSSQNSPPPSSFLTLGNSSKISLALMLLSMPTTLAMEYRGGKLRKICIWSMAISISSISKPWCCAISFSNSPTRSRITSLKTHFRYFGAHTRWYFVSYTAWLVHCNTAVSYRLTFSSSMPVMGRRVAMRMRCHPLLATPLRIPPRLQGGILRGFVNL